LKLTACKYLLLNVLLSRLASFLTSHIHADLTLWKIISTLYIMSELDMA